MDQMIAVHDIHEPNTGTWQYVVADPSTMSAAIIDSVLDFDPASASINNIFCGDSLFNADVGSARCDFPGGDATQLYNSVQKLLSHGPHVKIWTGHDYPPEARAGRAISAMTVSQQREQNKHLKDGTSQDEFVTWRSERDATLKEPRLIHYALQINIRAGRLPKPTTTGDRLVHVPLKSQF
ncbi:hydroxyacylglutathione hydrolase, partial [Metarhizium majus ARSEF 297]